MVDCLGWLPVNCKSDNCTSDLNKRQHFRPPSSDFGLMNCLNRLTDAKLQLRFRGVCVTVAKKNLPQITLITAELVQPMVIQN
jgi:hypothetical protein